MLRLQPPLKGTLFGMQNRTFGCMAATPENTCSSDENLNAQELMATTPLPGKHRQWQSFPNSLGIPALHARPRPVPISSPAEPEQTIPRQTSTYLVLFITLLCLASTVGGRSSQNTLPSEPNNCTLLQRRSPALQATSRAPPISKPFFSFYSRASWSAKYR
jgi:hypothetical protein